MVLQGRQKTACESRPGLIVGMPGQWLNVATMLNNKLDFYCCDDSVGFLHIYIELKIVLQVQKFYNIYRDDISNYISMPKVSSNISSTLSTMLLLYA